MKTPKKPSEPQAKPVAAPPPEPAVETIIPPEGLTCPLQVCRGKFQTSTAEPNPELQVKTTTCSVCGAAASCDVDLKPPAEEVASS